MRLATPLAAAALLALATAGATAGAAPAPDCNGQAYKDAKGDAALPSGDAPQLDILQGFTTVSGTDSTYHLQIADLSTQPVAPFLTLNWYLMWNQAEEERFVEASYSPESGVTYSYGILDPTLGFSQDGDVPVSGTFTEGPDGFISIVLPKDKVKVGDTMNTLHADTRAGIGTSTTGGLVSQADDAAGKTVKLTNCAAAPAPATPGPGATPAPGTPPAPGGSGGSGGGSTGGNPASAPVVQFSLVGKAGKAAKAAKKKKLALRIKSSGPVTRLTAKLIKGKKVVGSGKLAKLNGTAKLTIKLKSKRLKKGRYKLNVSGKDSSGRTAGATLPVKLG